MTRPDEDRLDAFFDAARAAPPVPSETLMARVAAQATEMQPAPAVAQRPLAAMLDALADVFGGWPQRAGLVAATAAGVAFGVGLSSASVTTDEAAAYLVFDEASAFSAVLLEE